MHHPNHLKSAIQRLFLPLIAILLISNGFSQQDFNNYQTLIAQGPIPTDFSATTQAKIQVDIESKRTNLSLIEERVFMEGIHHSIDELLHSGSVIYGDEVSVYVQSVAANLLKNEPELFSKLRFYTIKSNATNAFSTDQGIVFVTTGLISQLTSEAQLAYVLSHEIVHYSEQHVIETFEWRTQNTAQRKRIRELSANSKEHEFDADRIALKRYNEAGYSKEEIISTFDVLMYSYLPFDEVEVPNSYFSGDRMYIPDNMFAAKKYPITAEEDYDDEQSTHPNIKKRKDAVITALEEYANWGNVVYSQGEQSFSYVRNLARFESIRTEILDAHYGKALYSIFLLEREFPQSVYLQRMKALVWLGLAQSEENGQENSVPASSDYEGESAAMYFFLRKLKAEGLLAVATRNIYDISKDLPEDVMISGIRNQLLKTLAENDRFSWENYSSRNFQEVSAMALMKNDSVAQATEEKTEPARSKYDKIKTSRNVATPENFDSTRFYYYGLADVVLDDDFRASYGLQKEAYNRRKEIADSVDLVNRRKKSKKPANGTFNADGIALHDFVLVQPGTIFVKKGKQLWKEAEKSNRAMTDGLLIAAQKNGIAVEQIDHAAIAANGTDVFNQRNVVYSLLEQIANNENINFYPVDCDALKVVTDMYGSNNLLYTVTDYHYDANIHWGVVLYTLLAWPLLPVSLGIYVPIQLIRGHHTHTSVLVVDAASGDVKTAADFRYRSLPSKSKFNLNYTNLFKKLKMNPK